MYSEFSTFARDMPLEKVPDSFISQLPNWLTYLRLGLIPLFVLLMIDPSRSMVNLATVIFVVAASTDLIDGWIARKFGAVSDFGKLLDPLADKILVMAALVMLAAQRSDIYGEPWVPGWMVVCILAREIWVTGLRAVAAGNGNIVAASSKGKYKSVMQMVAIFLLLLHDYEIKFSGYVFTAQLFGFVLLLLSIVISYWGAAEYTQKILFDSEKKRG